VVTVAAALLTSIGQADRGEIKLPSAPIAGSRPAILARSERVTGGVGALVIASHNVTVRAIRLTTPSVISVRFAFDRSTISSRRQRAVLASTAAWLRTVDPATAIHIDGHTDSRGPASYNDALGERRAGTVRDALRRLLGGGGENLVARSFGERRPCDQNYRMDGTDDPRGRAHNRRVEIYAVEGDPRRTAAWIGSPCRR
jgi:outer membrane protein OmpA-like peptidoglycan-associated protein